MSNVQVFSKVTFGMINGPGPFSPVFFFRLYLMRELTFFCWHGNLKVLRGLPWIQNALLECSFEWLYSAGKCTDSPYI